MSATIGRLKRPEVTTAAIALAQAFDDSPLFTHLFPRPGSRPSILRSFFSATIRDAMAYENVFVARRDDAILGAAVWLPPGAYPPSTFRQLKQLAGMAGVVPRAPRSFVTSMRYLRVADRVHPRSPHWYLGLLGAVPRAQGQGLGSALLASVHDVADEDGSPSYLETDKEANLAFYARFRYQLVDTLRPDGPDGPPIWTMSRDPVPPDPPPLGHSRGPEAP